MIACYLVDLWAHGVIPSHNVTPFWPTTPLLVAMLLATPRRMWPALFVAGFGAMFLLDLRSGWSLASVTWYSLANLIEVLVVTLGMSRLYGNSPYFDSVKSFAHYLAFVVLATFASAFPGAIGTTSGGYWLQWRLWLLGDSLGFLLVVPAILTWIREGRAWARKPLHWLELAALMIAVLVFGYLAFTGIGQNGPSPALLYVLVPLLLWAAVRLGLKGVSTSIILVAILAYSGAAHDRGPFAGRGPLSNALSLQLFLCFATLPFMFLAVLVGEEKLAQQAIRESEKRFRLVANTAPVMIWMSGPDRLRTYFNQPWLDFTGSSLESVLGDGWAGALHLDDLSHCLETCGKAFDRRDSFEMEYRLRRNDGEYRWVSDRGVPRVNSDGSLAGYIGSCIDVTERKLAQEALADFGRKLIEAHEQERGRIARELHDDINQRLTLLAVNLGNLKQGLPSSPALLQRQIEEACNQTEDLGSEIHALSHRLHSSKLEYLGIEAAASGFCRELSEQQGMQIQFHSEHVPKKVPQEIGLCLFRVLQEALHNAVKHSGSQLIDVSLKRVADEIELVVCDSGIGFDAETAIGRNGLGLVSMKERLKLVSGKLSVNSKVPRGTEVRATVPLDLAVKSAEA
jgi:PAS domain S-box-containing protein